MKITLTQPQIDILISCAEFAISGEWPWDDKSPAVLDNALAALRKEQSPTPVEDDLAFAAELLRNANPANRQWAEKRDSFLEAIGEFKEPGEHADGDHS